MLHAQKRKRKNTFVCLFNLWGFKENKVLQIVIKNTDQQFVSKAFTPQICCLLKNNPFIDFGRIPFL